MQWRVWLTSEPRGAMREDFRSAQITQAVYSVIASFGSSKPPKLGECLLKFTPPDQTSVTIRNVQAAMRIFGGKYKDEAAKLLRDAGKIEKT